MAHFRETAVKQPCPSCGAFKVAFEMTTIPLDGRQFSYRVGSCYDCGHKRYGGLRYGTSNGRPEGDAVAPHKCHYEAAAGRYEFAQCSGKKGAGPGQRYCANHARQVETQLQCQAAARANSSPERRAEAQ